MSQRHYPVPRGPLFLINHSPNLHQYLYMCSGVITNLEQLGTGDPTVGISVRYPTGCFRAPEGRSQIPR